jgi:endonuclease/exonuclease/phosphatase family metal-dependent hydrolase
MQESSSLSLWGRVFDARRRKTVHSSMHFGGFLLSVLLAGVPLWILALTFSPGTLSAQNCTPPSAPTGLRILVGVSGGSPAPPGTTSPCTSTPLRFMTWNIHGGRNTSNVLVPSAQVQFMVAQNPHVIVLQEVSTWDQHQTQIPALINQATGVTWASFFAPSEPCLKGGGCIGELILTRLPMLSQSMTYLPPSSAARAQVRVGTVPIQVFSVHFSVDTTLRTTQLNQFMTWARTFGTPALVGGDFNSWWGESWIAQMTTEYYDTWRQLTGSNQNGHTIGNVRFDYIFRSIANGNRVTPVSVWVPATTLSDHNPVLADFRVQ